MSSDDKHMTMFHAMMHHAQRLQSTLLTTGLGVTSLAMAGDALYYVFMRALQRRAMGQTMYSQTLKNEPTSALIDRVDARNYILRKVSQLSTFTLLLSSVGTGSTTMLRQLASEERGIMYVSLLAAKTLEDVTQILITELNIAENVRMSTLSLMLHKWLKLSEVVEEDADEKWDHVTSIYEAIASDVQPRLERDAAAFAKQKEKEGTPLAYPPRSSVVLIFDHTDSLDDEAAAAIQSWAAGCQVKGKIHVLLAAHTGFRFFGTAFAARQEVIVLPSVTLEAALRFSRKRLRNMPDEMAEKVVSRVGCSLGDLHQVFRFFEEDANIVTPNSLCAQFSRSGLTSAVMQDPPGSEPTICIENLPLGDISVITTSIPNPIMSLDQGIIFSEKKLWQRLESYMLFHFQTRCRPWHMYGPHAMDDPVLDEQRFYLFCIALKLEQKECDDISCGRTPHGCCYATMSTSLNFEELFEFVPMRVYATYVDKRDTMPFSLMFNEARWLQPGHKKCLQWSMGVPSSVKRRRFVEQLPKLLEEAKHPMMPGAEGILRRAVRMEPGSPLLAEPGDFQTGQGVASF